MRTLAPPRRPTPLQDAVISTALKVDRACEILNTREQLAYLDTMSRVLRRKHDAIEAESQRPA